MNVLVTGGAGFIGSYVVERLIEEGHFPIVLTEESNNIPRIKHLSDKIKVYDKKDELSKIFSENKIDAVFHLATLYRKEDDESLKEEMKQNNITFPKNILDEMLKNNIKYFINTGTFFEYSPKNTPLNEEDEICAFNFYAQTKIDFNNILKEYSLKGIKAITLRLFSPYGPRDNTKLVISLINSLIKNEKIEVTSGEQELSWTYVKDISDSYILALNYLQKMQNNFEVFNIGCKSERVSRIFNILEKLSNKKNVIKRLRPYSENEIMFGSCDNSKARNLLGWQPKVELDEGIEETYNYCLKNSRVLRETNFVKTKILGVYVVENKVFKDHRGKFVKPFNFGEFEKIGIKFEVKEHFFSDSTKGTIRGMHFQIPPEDHAKIVYVTRGKVIDVVVDLRKESPTYGQFVSEELSEDNDKSFYIPIGCAHGFQVLSDIATTAYLQSTSHNIDYDSGIKYDSFGFNWPIENPILSEKDLGFKALSEFDSPFSSI